MNAPGEKRSINGTLPLSKRYAILIVLGMLLFLFFTFYIVSNSERKSLTGSKAQNFEMEAARNESGDLLSRLERAAPEAPEEIAPVADILPPPVPVEEGRRVVVNRIRKPVTPPTVTEFRRNRSGQIQALALQPSEVSFGGVTFSQEEVKNQPLLDPQQNPYLNMTDGEVARNQILAQAGAAMAVSAENDPNGWARKAQFLKQDSGEDFRSPYGLQAPFSPFELQAGTLIPAVLTSGLNTDLPGPVMGQVSENVYSSVTGEYLLIPRGSRLLGTYDSQVSQGQSRVLVVWQRLIFPDGTSIALGNAQGTDAAGYTGFKGQINRHFNSLLTSALAVSVLAGGMDVAAPKAGLSTTGQDGKNSSYGTAAGAVGQALGGIIQSQARRQPTIKVKQGYRFQIYIQKDMILPPRHEP